MQRLAVLADDDFSGAPANINHQPLLLAGGQGAGDAAVNQARFFLAGDDLDRKAQQLAAAQHKFLGIECFAQGLGGNSAHLGGIKTGQTLAKAGQTIPAALHGLARQFVAGIEAIALAHSFFEVFNAFNALMGADATNFQAKAVGAKVYSSKQRFRSHF